MKIISAFLYSLRIPFKNAFSHTLKTRTYSDSVIVKLVADSGETGFGELIARPYVTGESVSSCLDYIQKVLLPAIGGRDFHHIDGKIEPWILLSTISAMLPDAGRGSVVAWNASKAAVELALIDTMFKQAGKSIKTAIPPAVESVTYSAVITADSAEKTKKIALECRKNGMKYLKIKVRTTKDHARIKAVRDILGDSVSLRIDANGAFDASGAISFISSVQPYHIVSIEQPVPRSDIKALAQVKKDSPIPVMVDESLITERDAAELIENNACDLFNLRISKNGGLSKTLQLAQMARRAGIGIQLGCQVGETAILSAAGRHIAAHLQDLKFIEGSYGTLLLEEDIAEEAVQFGYAGKAGLLDGPGFGIHVREDLLEKYAETTVQIKMV